VLDPLLEDYVVDNLPFAELARKYGEEIINKVLRMVKVASLRGNKLR